MNISHKFAWLAMLILFSLIMTGCAGASVKPEQPLSDSAVALDSMNSVGETFTAHYDGLTSLLIYLSPLETGEGQIILQLRSGPTDADVLRTASMPIDQVTQPGFYAFEFPALEVSNLKDYYAQLEVDGTGRAEVGTASGETYLFGALYQNEQPQDAQLTFALGYQSLYQWTGLIKEGLRGFLWLLAGLFLFVLPGWALLDAIWSGWNQLSWAEKLGLSAGTGLALYPVLFLWTDLVGLHLGRFYAWLPGSLSLIWLIWHHRASVLHWQGISNKPLINFHRTAKNGDLALVFVIGLIIFTRFWAIRQLDIPLWGDSYQHAMMSQLILDNGGLFNTWEPYSPYYTLTVHFGFPAQTALFAWIVGIDGSTATLIFGQVINILAVLTLLPLALRLSQGSRWAGGATLIIAGLLSQMPAYYANWGRFAQLGGQAILPVVCWLAWDILSRSDSHFGRLTRVRSSPLKQDIFWFSSLILVGLVLTGSLLTYYRMTFFFLTFMITWAITLGLPQFRFYWRRWAAVAVSALVIGLSSITLVLPWFLHTQNSHLGTLVETGMNTGRQLNNILADLQSWRSIREYVPQAMIWIIVVAIFWAAPKRQWIIPGLMLWAGLLIAYYLGQAIRIPGANMLGQFTILISLYIPASLIIGWLAGSAIGGLKMTNGLVVAFINLVLIMISLYGANDIRNVVDPKTYSLVTRPDLRAIGWIQQNSSATTRFLVEGFTIYNGTSAVGSDAGWWIPLLSVKENTMPPQYALMNEVPHPLNYSKKIVSLVRGLEKYPPGSAEGLNLLCKNRITHIYIGQTQGKIGTGVRQLFSPGDFANHPAFKQLYHQDRVYIFTMKGNACSTNKNDLQLDRLQDINN